MRQTKHLSDADPDACAARSRVTRLRAGSATLRPIANGLLLVSLLADGRFAETFYATLDEALPALRRILAGVP